MIAFSKSLQEDIREKTAMGVYPPIVTRSHAEISLEAALQAAKEGRFDVAANLSWLARDLFIKLHAERSR